MIPDYMTPERASKETLLKELAKELGFHVVVDFEKLLNRLRREAEGEDEARILVGGDGSAHLLALNEKIELWFFGYRKELPPEWNEEMKKLEKEERRAAEGGLPGRWMDRDRSGRLVLQKM